MDRRFLDQPVFFEWDRGNSQKNYHKHQVSDGECEEVFFAADKILLADHKHSGTEARHILFGETRAQRKLIIIFTLRHTKIRVISARDLNKRERKLYEEAIKNPSL